MVCAGSTEGSGKTTWEPHALVPRRGHTVSANQGQVRQVNGRKETSFLTWLLVQCCFSKPPHSGWNLPTALLKRSLHPFCLNKGQSRVEGTVTHHAPSQRKTRTKSKR